MISALRVWAIRVIAETAAWLRVLVSLVAEENQDVRIRTGRKSPGRWRLQLLRMERLILNPLALQPTTGPMTRGLQFSPYHLKEMGEAFCQALLLLDHPDGRASALRADDILASARRVSPATFATPESDEEQQEQKADGRKPNKKAGEKGNGGKNRAKHGDDDDDEEQDEEGLEEEEEDEEGLEEKEDEEEQQAQACAASSDVDEASYGVDDNDGEFGAGDDLDDFNDALDEEEDDNALLDGSDIEDV